MKKYNVGDYLMHENAGVCKVDSIEEKALSGKGSERLYYNLVPVYQNSTAITTPVESKVRLRDVKPAAEMEALFDQVGDLDIIVEPNDRVRSEKYKEAMAKFEPIELARVLKTVYQRRLERMAAGKKVMSLDEKVMQLASRKLYEEMAFSLNEETSVVEERFLNVLVDICHV